MTGTANKAVSVYENSRLSVSPDIKALLPEVLIAYLWKLALCEDWQGNEKILLTLKAEELSGRNIQAIYCTCDNGISIDKRRVYGVPPINCSLQIFYSYGSYQMQLCKDA